MKNGFYYYERNTIYEQNLIATIIKNSNAYCWENAVEEWDIIKLEKKDPNSNPKCICGNEGRFEWLYTIKNLFNGKVLYPITNGCIKRFKRADLNFKADTLKEMYILYSDFKARDTIELSGRYFSRNLLKALFLNGAFVGNKYNNYDGESDYAFMLYAFNIQNKLLITEKERKKIHFIIKYQIKPFIFNKFESDSDYNVEISNEDDESMAEIYKKKTLDSGKPKKIITGLKIRTALIDENGNKTEESQVFECDGESPKKERETPSICVEDDKPKMPGIMDEFFDDDFIYNRITLGNFLYFILKNKFTNINTDNETFPEGYRYEEIEPLDLYNELKECPVNNILNRYIAEFGIVPVYFDDNDYELYDMDEDGIIKTDITEYDHFVNPVIRIKLEFDSLKSNDDSDSSNDDSIFDI